MADEADRSDKKIEDAVNDGVNEASRAVAAMPQGEAGECDLCGEFMLRLVGGACAPCRDRYKLP